MRQGPFYVNRRVQRIQKKGFIRCGFKNSLYSIDMLRIQITQGALILHRCLQLTEHNAQKHCLALILAKDY